MSKYPAQIDNIVSLPLVADNLSAVTGDTSNRLRNAIVAIEAELGVKPAGVYSTVRGRLDALETAIGNLQISGLEGDVTGGLSTTKVSGLGGRPFSDQLPIVNQVITWNGIAWVPQALSNITLNVLPTSVVLPATIEFLSGDGYSSFSSPTRVGARAVDLSLYPASYPDGRTRTLTFVANLEVTNESAIGYAQLKDVTNNVIITDSVLSTNSLGSVELSAIINGGDIDGYMQTGQIMYEVQIFIEDGGINDYVICRNARIDVTYSSPILVSALVPLSVPADINFVAGMIENTSSTPFVAASRMIDMTKFPVSLPDGRARTVKFLADAEVSDTGVDGYLQLWDVTHSNLVTGTGFHFIDTLTEEKSVTLTVGSSSGNLRSDVTTRYEIRIWKTNGSVTDRIVCNNARLQITYA